MKFLFAHQLNVPLCRPSSTLCTNTSRDFILWEPVIFCNFPTRPSEPTSSRRQPSSGWQLTRTRKSPRWRLTTTHLPKDSGTQEPESHRKSKPNLKHSRIKQLKKAKLHVHTCLACSHFCTIQFISQVPSLKEMKEIYNRVCELRGIKSLFKYEFPLALTWLDATL